MTFWGRDARISLSSYACICLPNVRFSANKMPAPLTALNSRRGAPWKRRGLGAFESIRFGCSPQKLLVFSVLYF